MNYVPGVEAELYSIKDSDHLFLVINRQQDSSQPDKPETWGENAVICDPFVNKAYRASQYIPELISDYFNPKIHTLEPHGNFKTNYLRSIRTIDNLKKGFIAHQKYLTETLTFYQGLLTEELQELKDEPDKFAIVTNKIKHIEQQIKKFKIEMDNFKNVEYKEDYRVVRAELKQKFALIKIEALATMHFSAGERSILFKPNKTEQQELYDNMLKTQTMMGDVPLGEEMLPASYEQLKTFSMFNDNKKSITERQFQQIGEAVNSKLIQLKRGA